MNTTAIRDFIVREFLSGDSPESLTAQVPLISSGLIDSVGTLKLVLFLEETFNVEIDPAEIAEGKLDSLQSIEELLHAKGVA